LLSALILTLLVALSIVAWWVVRSGVDGQEEDLLKTQVNQVSIVLQTDVEKVSLALGSLGPESKNLDAQANALRSDPGITIALVTKGQVVDAQGDVAAGPPQVRYDDGPALRQGEQLTGELAKIALAARPSLSATPVIDVAGKPYEVFSIVPSSVTVPGYVVMEVSEIFPSVRVPLEGPDHKLDISIYATTTVQRSQLLESSVGLKPLPQPTASVVMRFDLIEWDLVGGANSPLLGTAAQVTPWIVLGVGILLAVGLSFTVEALMRRQRYTAAVVAQREAELAEEKKMSLRNERLAALGEFATVVGHELRNPLGAAINALFLQRMELSGKVDEGSLRHLGLAEAQIERATKLSEDLIAYMREREIVTSNVEIEQLFGEVLESAPPPPGIEVSVHAPVHVTADPNLLKQVMTNILINAYQAMDRGGTIEVNASE